MKVVALGLVMGVVCAGCTKDWQRARHAAAFTLQCPKELVHVEEGKDHWFAQGCDRHAVCAEHGGTCRLAKTIEEVMITARDTFAEESGCPALDVKVMLGAEGVLVDGCGRYALCPEGGSTCLSRDRPSCKQLAQLRLDGCVAAARGEGIAGRSTWGSNVAIVSSAVTSSIAQNRSMDTCQKNYESDAAACGGSGGGL